MEGRTQYFLGDFDGDKFIQQQKEEEPLWIDFGFDNYAGVTFQNLEQPLFLGWAMNWGMPMRRRPGNTADK